jgi:hypothetical protein
MRFLKEFSEDDKGNDVNMKPFLLLISLFMGNAYKVERKGD